MEQGFAQGVRECAGEAVSEAERRRLAALAESAEGTAGDVELLEVDGDEPDASVPPGPGTGVGSTEVQ